MSAVEAPQRAGPRSPGPGADGAAVLPGKGTGLSAAASRSYSVAKHWELLAVLSDEQQAAMDLISQHCAERPVPDHIVDDASDAAPASGPSGRGDAPAAKGPSHARFDDAVLHSAAEFHKWHSELEATRTSETQEQFRRYAATLQGYLDACNELLGKVDQTLAFFGDLKSQHHEVAAKTRQLHDSCQQLVSEKDQLADFAASLRSKLAFFDELEAVGSRFHGSGAPSVDSDAFLPLLARLEDSLAFVAAHPQYADAGAYAGKFRALQQRALSAVRSRVSAVLRHASEQVQLAIREGRGGGSSAQRATADSAESRAGATAGRGSAAAVNGALPALPEGAEASLLYVRFRAAAEPGLKGLLAGVAARSNRPEYSRLLADCRGLYCETRLGLVAPVTRSRIAALASQPLPALTRAGCAYLMQACQMEHQLHEHFFPSDASGGSSAPSGGAADGSGLEALMEPLCTILYDVLRPAFILLQRLDELCELVDILKHEVLGEQLGRRGDAVAPLRPMLNRTLADVRHRLVFRAHTFVKEEVAGYQPKPEDLDYPGKLQRRAVAAAQEGGPLAAPPGAGELPVAPLNDPQAEGDAAAVETWWPPVAAALRALGQLYGALDGRTFGGLAQDAVAAATASVQTASRAVAKRSGPMDGQLFVIKQLLVLREQIAPFQADFAVVDKQLDFSHMRDHLRRIAGGPGQLFSLGADNAVLQLVSRGGPRVLESQVDSKKELERALKAGCEAFIMGVTKLTVDDMLSFITKVTAVKVASASKPLREQAFASPARLAEMVARVKAAMQGPLPAAVDKMRLYMASSGTHAVLLKPIKANIAEAHGQIASLLEAEYPEEERAQIGLTPPDELAKILDALG